jgi:hypothetical protein
MPRHALRPTGYAGSNLTRFRRRRIADQPPVRKKSMPHQPCRRPASPATLLWLLGSDEERGNQGFCRAASGAPDDAGRSAGIFGPGGKVLADVVIPGAVPIFLTRSIVMGDRHFLNAYVGKVRAIMRFGSGA